MNQHALNQVLWTARRAAGAMQRAKEQELRPLDLAAAHYLLLAAIAFNPGATGAEVARELGVTPQNIAGLTSRLERRGLVRRQPHPRHKHILEMRITPEGEELLAQADTAMMALEGRITAFLGAEDAATLASLLDRLADGLEAPREV